MPGIIARLGVLSEQLSVARALDEIMQPAKRSTRSLSAVRTLGRRHATPGVGGADCFISPIARPCFIANFATESRQRVAMVPEPRNDAHGNITRAENNRYRKR